MGPEFSVIIPAYNAERYVAQTLQALNGQSFDSYEIVVVDDGSTDGTYGILEDVACRNSRVKVFRQTNAGPLIARRTALSHARGEYAVFLDADDLLRNDALAVIDNVIKSSRVDIVSFPFSRASDFSSAEGMQLSPGEYRAESYTKVKTCVCHGRFNSLWGKAIRLCRIDTDAAYGAYDGLMHGEDLFQLLPIIDSSESLVQIDTPLYFYRDNDASSTSCFKARQLEDIVVVNRRLVEYASKWGGACLQAAAIGEARQYINLLKMSENSKASRSDKESNYRVIRSAMVEEDVFERCLAVPQRLDDRMLLSALQHDRKGLARLLVKLVEAAKHASHFHHQ